MLTLAWLLLILVLLFLVTGAVLSIYYTRRSQLGETHSPGEYGLQFEAVEFKAEDGLILRGVWIPARGSDKAIISLHGHGSSHDFDIYRAPALHNAGFNVLLFDLRAHGRSEGKRMTFGYEDRRDVIGAIDFLHQRGIQHIGLLGFSYGGVVAMLSTPICPDVEAVISDGGPCRWRTAADTWADDHLIPRWLSRLFIWVVFAMLSLRLGANIFNYDAIHWVGKISPRPILFIHGDLDRYCADFDDLYAAAKPPKELWRLPDVGHNHAQYLFPEEHIRRVIDFFSRYLR